LLRPVRLFWTVSLFAVLAAAPVPVRALEWTVRDLELKTAVGQPTAAVAYPFRNDSGRPVHVLAVVPSCSCMAALPPKEVYVPGEEGEIRVEVSLAGYVGRLRRSVTVETDEPGRRFVDLTLMLDIPESAVFTPRFLFWQVGDKAEEKSLQIVLADPARSSLGDVVSTDPAFQSRLEPAGRPDTFRLWVRPVGTEERADATIQVKVRFGDRAETRVVYVAVKERAPGR
jgi:hypothetical protein